jgi:KaiC/GvpD/RAD55 family RecA-like ATPase
MRGIAPGELAMILGYSHSGKTLALLQMLKANANKRVVYFVPDEPRTLVLLKLACVTHGVDARELERAISKDERHAIDMLRETANDVFPTLAVFDESLTISDMEKAYHETANLWGDPPELGVLDYLELLQGGGEDVPSKANTMKAWGRRHDLPLLVLHQTSRTAGSEGKKMSISSGAFGGEQQATHIIGVRRKKFDIMAQITELETKMDRSTASEKAMDRLDMLRYELRVHDHTVTLNLVKNKRPGGQLIDDIDFEIERGSGILTPLNGNLPSQYLAEARKEVDNG